MHPEGTSLRGLLDCNNQLRLQVKSFGLSVLSMIVDEASIGF